MAKKSKKSTQMSIKSIFLVLVLLIASKFTIFNDTNSKELESKNNTQYESRIDKNKQEEKVSKKDKESLQKNSKEKNEQNVSKKKYKKNTNKKDRPENLTFDYKRDIPEYFGKLVYNRVNNNTPYFSKPKSTKVYKKYSDLDYLNRVGACELVTGPEYLPKEKRGDISHVKPTGWKQKKYDFVDGKYLYNRCHLIGHQIAGDNDDWRNLMTGTRAMNVDGMLPYENIVANYIKKTGHHVKYRVTPVFLGEEKVARGVLMEARSIEDDKVKFNVFCYNVQPRVVIDYATGYSKLDR